MGLKRSGVWIVIKIHKLGVVTSDVRTVKMHDG